MGYINLGIFTDTQHPANTGHFLLPESLPSLPVRRSGIADGGAIRPICHSLAGMLVSM